MISFAKVAKAQYHIKMLLLTRNSISTAKFIDFFRHCRWWKKLSEKNLGVRDLLSNKEAKISKLFPLTRSAC